MHLAADAVLVIHLAFIVFVMFGGLLVLKWHWLAVLHLPAAIWGIVIQFSGWLCPLTPLENMLRRAAGESGYHGGFIEHYLLPIIYPAGLTREIQFLLGAVVLLVNLGIYLYVLRRRSGRH